MVFENHKKVSFYNIASEASLIFNFAIFVELKLPSEQRYQTC